MTDPAGSGARSPFEDDASAVYDEIFSRRPDHGFYRWAAERYGGPILEVGCGTGRILVPTALAGFEIIGIDPNASRIDVCRERIEAEGVGKLASAVVGDIRDFSTARRFALVTSPFRSFQHILTPADQLRALRNVWDHLAPGGHFILDVFNPSIPLLADDGLRQEFGDQESAMLPDGGRVELRSRILERDYVLQLQHAEEIYIFTMPDGATRRVALPYTTRYTFRYEYEHMAALVGFEICDLFGSYDREPFGADYPGEILMVMRRPA